MGRHPVIERSVGRQVRRLFGFSAALMMILTALQVGSGETAAVDTLDGEFEAGRVLELGGGV